MSTTGTGGDGRARQGAVAAAATMGWGARAAVLAAVTPLALVVLLPLMAVGAPQGPADPQSVGIDPVVLDAYLDASMRVRDLDGGCALPWTVLAAVGKVESNHAGGRVVGDDGAVAPPVVGVALDGTGGTLAVRDSDNGAWDGDAVWDRAVGPMQFIPSSWRVYGRDASGDGIADPHNIYDAASGAAAHLCAAGLTVDTAELNGAGDGSDEAALRAALFSYNRSAAYVDEVLAWTARYDALTAGGVLDGDAVGGYALPLDRSWFDAHPGWLTRPHHDYPAADLPVPEGTPVRAVSSGTVAAVTRPGSRCGRGAVIDGADGYQYVYCHASAVLVAVGEVVSVGQTILFSGNTGNSHGPHLHFGIRRGDGVDLCPQALLTAWYHGRAATPLVAAVSGCVS